MRGPLPFLIAFLFLSACGVMRAPSPASPTPSAHAPGSAPFRPSADGEGWESSGGSGVACFDSAETAKAANAWLARHGSLNDDLRDHIRELVTLEYWDWKEKYHFVSATGTYEQRLSEVRRIFREYSPIFASRLELVDERLDFPQWEESRHLPRIEDRHPLREVEKAHPECRLVQLAVRYTRKHPGRLPEARVEVDGKLFREKLDALNQAILVLHEQMYLIGKETGHETSDALRGVVALFFSEDLRRALKQQRFHSHAARIVQEPIAYIYGDYYRFFLDEPSEFSDRAPRSPNQYTRYHSFGHMLLLLRTRKGKCLEENHYDQQPKEKQAELQESCSLASVWPYDLPEIFNDEEAFLFVARWLLDPMGALLTSENLVSWDRARPDLVTDLQQDELDRACQAVHKFDFPNFRALLAMTKRYCTRLGLEPPPK